MHSNIFQFYSSLIVAILFAGSTISASPRAGTPVWTNVFAPGTGYALALADNGNVIVTGVRTGSPGGDFATIAYAPSGSPLWTIYYHGPGSFTDQPTGIALNGQGAAFVTGFSTGATSGYDYTTIVYSSVGVPLWTNRYDGPGNFTDQARAIAVSSNSNVLVTGTSAATNKTDCATLSYSSIGVPLWTNFFNDSTNENARACSIGADTNGNVFVLVANGITPAMPRFHIRARARAGGRTATVARQAAMTPPQLSLWMAPTTLSWPENPREHQVVSITPQ
jgi:hypothetical protein